MFLILGVTAALTHPIAFVFVAIIALTTCEGAVGVLPAFVIMFLLLPAGAYSISYDFVNMYRHVLIGMNISLLGILTIRKDQNGIILVLALLATMAFVVLATWTQMMVTYVNMILIPPLVKMINKEES